MRRAMSLAAALLFVGAAQPTQSEPMQNASKTAHAAPHAVIVRTALREPAIAPGEARGKIAMCANLAAVRALDAKAVGASYAAQDRILDLTFVLCMSGPESRD